MFQNRASYELFRSFSASLLGPASHGDGRRASPARTAWNAVNRAPLRVFQGNLARPGPNHHLARLEGATRADPDESGLVRLYLRGKYGRGALPRVVDAAEAAGFTVTDLSITEPTLETVFITLTGKDLRE